MNSETEIATQNLQDCGSILYKNLAGSIFYEHGKDGETVVRRANHRCGVRMGQLERARNERDGRLSNLKTLFTSPAMGLSDPRFRIQWQLFSEEEAVFDVVTCPVYDMLKEDRDQRLVLSYCEEYHHGCIMGYTDQIGQCCLSEHFAFPGENSCCLGCYFRAANLSPQARSGRFSENFREEAPFPSSQISEDAFKEKLSLWAGLLVESYLEECGKSYGRESTWIVSEGLRSAALESARFLLKRSACTGQKPDESYVSKNALWGGGENPAPDRESLAEKMIDMDYSLVLRRELRL